MQILYPDVFVIQDSITELAECCLSYDGMARAAIKRHFCLEEMTM